MKLDQHQFRQALGQFATGVTIITTRDERGDPIGFTANSFNSVSLEPPLVLWSLAKAASTYKAFLAANHYAVNVLAADQLELSNRFASPVDNRFADLEFVSGATGTPRLENAVACFECRREFHYPGGDHLIFVARVLDFSWNPERQPLLYHQGRYRRIID